jgi:hypothetical protein
MDNKTELDLSTWFSTYGLLTSSNILGTLNIYLSEEDLLPAIKKSSSVYHQLLAIPIKSVLNGIIYQQAYDYQVYVQKLFVDYLLSGEQGKDSESPGASIREQLEEYRLEVAKLNDAFSEKQREHQKLIMQSQASLIKCAAELQTMMAATGIKVKEILAADHITKDDSVINGAIRSLVINFDHLNQRALAADESIWVNFSKSLQMELKEETKKKLAGVLDVLDDPKSDIANIVLAFKDDAEDIGLSFRTFRSKFYDLILVVTESINMLPDYHVNLAQEKTNRESLYFDAHLGDDLGKSTA